MAVLDAGEARVVGALAEKQLTIPQQYPLSLNALVAACNQTTNRDPVVEYAERDVEALLARLKEKRLVRFVHPTHGRGVTRYRQVLDEVLHLRPEELAVLTVLLLRGPQTPGELRARTDRLADLREPGAVERVLDALAARDEPLVRRLERSPGQKEARVVHLLCGDDAATQAAARAGSGAGSGGTPSDERVSALEGEVRALHAAVDGLRRELAGLRAELDGRRLELG